MSTFSVSQVFGFLHDFIDYCTNTTFNCTDPIPPCQSSKRLDFASLWTITYNYYKLCGSDGAWLSESTVGLASAALTAAAAYEILGKGYTKFPKADIWSRLTTWKFPLIQLIATSPRPPLGKLVEVLTVLHLASDPICSIEDLLYKLEGCQRRAVYWQNQIRLRDVALQMTPIVKEEKKKRKW